MPPWRRWWHSSPSSPPCCCQSGLLQATVLDLEIACGGVVCGCFLLLAMVSGAAAAPRARKHAAHAAAPPPPPPQRVVAAPHRGGRAARGVAARGPRRRGEHLCKLDVSTGGLHDCLLRTAHAPSCHPRSPPPPAAMRCSLCWASSGAAWPSACSSGAPPRLPPRPPPQRRAAPRCRATCQRAPQQRPHMGGLPAPPPLRARRSLADDVCTVDEAKTLYPK